MIDYIVEVIGEAPPGLEFLQYVFAGGLMFFGIYVVYKILSVFLSKII